MATTPANFSITPYWGGLAKVGGNVSPVAATPATVKLVKTDVSQVSPNASGYTLTLSEGWLYTASIADALAGVYYWYAETSDPQVIAHGYIFLADTTITRFASLDLTQGIDGYSLEEALKLMAAVTLGKVTGGGTTSNVFRAADDSKDRVTATVDTTGNRSSITLDATG